MDKEVLFKVVEINGERLFEIDGLMFDRLQAYDFFEGGQLFVCRNGELFDQTSGIYETGTHAACTSFLGLRKVDEYYGVGEVYPDRFILGDRLNLLFTCEHDFDFKKFLQEDFIKHVALVKSFKKMPKGLLSDFRVLLLEEVGEAMKDENITDANILRFSWE